MRNADFGDTTAEFSLINWDRNLAGTGWGASARDETVEIRDSA
jgi:hypothetical protein